MMYAKSPERQGVASGLPFPRLGPGILRRMAKKDAAGGTRTGRIAQIRSVYSMTRKADPKIGWIMLASFLGTVAVFVVLGLVIGSVWFFVPLGVVVGFLVATIVFGRRAERSAFAQMEGQPGAALAVLKSIKRGWAVTEVVAAAPSQRPTDVAVVHRAVGRPGVVLIGEGNPNRLTPILAAEKRKMARMLGDVPVYDTVVGNNDNQVPLRRLRAYMMKLPRNMSRDQVREVNSRLRALPGIQQQVPRGPLPKNVRMPKTNPKIR
jgi:hypothetical protein